MEAYDFQMSAKFSSVVKWPDDILFDWSRGQYNATFNNMTVNVFVL